MEAILLENATTLTDQTIPFPLQTEEQAINTRLFLQLVADTYRTGYCCAIFEQHKCSKNSYKKYRDGSGNLQYVLDCSGQKVPQKIAGVSWTTPSLYDCLQQTNSLLLPHQSLSTGKQRPSLLQTLANATIDHKFLFAPVLLQVRSILKDYKEVVDPISETTKWMPCSRSWVEKAYDQYVCQAIATDAPYIALPPVIKRKYTPYNGDDVRAARCLWVDVDGHGSDITPAMTQHAVERLLEVIGGYCVATDMPVPAVVSTGRGVHLYWWFSAAVDLHSKVSQSEFKALLVAATQWVSDLLEWDPVMSRVWSPDKSTNAIFRLMHLPGTINPSTGTARYVTNRYGRDYQRVDFETLASTLSDYIPAAMKESSPKQVKTSPSKELPAQNTAVQIELQCGKKTDAPASMQFPTALAKKPYTRGRLARLLRWADGREWSLQGKREIFLFLCGCMVQQQTDSTISADHHPLFEINHFLSEPLDDGEVEKIVNELNHKARSSTDPYSKWYLYKSATITELLGMTEEEAKQFLNTPAGTYQPYKAPSFSAKLAEIMVTEEQRVGETPEAYKQRCYEMTREFYSAQRRAHPRNTNAARDRRRKDVAAARQENENRDAEQCKKLKGEGLSIRSIANTLGLSKSKVARLLKNS